jgi:hypothetical protein
MLAMAKKKAQPLPATRPLDYSMSLSAYERESLAAEAQLAYERKRKKLRTTRTK